MTRRSVRPRRDSDLDALASVLRTVHELGGYPVNWPNDPRAWLTPSDLTAAWAAEAAEAPSPIGHCAVTRVDPGHPTAAIWEQAVQVPSDMLDCVTRLFVLPRHRGAGLGAELLRAAAANAHSQGRRAVLEVLSSDSSAVELYRRQGWRETGVGERAEWMPAGSTSLLFMAPEDPLH